MKVWSITILSSDGEAECERFTIKANKKSEAEEAAKVLVKFFEGQTEYVENLTYSVKEVWMSTWRSIIYLCEDHTGNK